MDLNDPSFYNYTAGRWAFQEEKRLAERKVNFSMEGLIKVAAECIGVDQSSCTEVTKLPEGHHYKIFLLTMAKEHETHKLIAKIPNPNAGAAFHMIASEAARTIFVKEMGITVPHIHRFEPHRFSSDADVEYIIMDQAMGLPLNSAWPTMTISQKADLISNIIHYEQLLIDHQFPGIGSLYLLEHVKPRRKWPWKSLGNGRFALGPTTSDDRRKINTDRGSWKTTTEWIDDLVARERRCIEDLSPLLNFYPGSVEDKLALLHHFETYKDRLWTDDVDAERRVLWHGGLHQDHIFVDPVNPSKVLSIISWQGVHVAPLFSHVRIPAFLDFDGLKPIPFINAPMLPLPENFKQHKANERNEILTLRQQRAFWKYYEYRITENHTASVALAWRFSLEGEIFHSLRKIFDGEPPYVRELLHRLSLRETSEEFEHVEPPSADDKMRWEQTEFSKAEIHEQLGVLDDSWDGWVAHERYESTLQILKSVESSRLEQYRKDPWPVMSHHGGEAWLRFWPYQDYGLMRTHYRQ